ncbi:DUF6520 family protein [Sinomicrobium pectinilyticum]|nr:DUF6520 family protein [Sinomicrobium pectinilyticum]
MMKKTGIFMALAAFVFAIGTAFATKANEVSTDEVSSTDISMQQLAYYRTIPNDPNSCTTFMQVPCNPVPKTPQCVWFVPGIGNSPLYNASCQPLYYDPVP